MNRIISLHQRIEKFVQTDGLPVLLPFGEIVALEQPGHGYLAGQPDHGGKIQSGQPLAVEMDRGAGRVEDPENLFPVGFRIDAYLFS